jgi:predicted amidophosphoribosyltransferase
MTCPSCQQPLELVLRAGPVGICKNCGASVLHQQDGTVRRATAMDLDVLSPGERASLVKAHSSIVRPKP